MSTSALPGQHDPSFNALFVRSPDDPCRFINPEFQLLRPDGSFVLGCQDAYYFAKERPCLVQVLADGRLDTSFGDKGYAFIDFADSRVSDFYITGIHQLPDNGGYIVRLAAALSDRRIRVPALARFTSGGQKDPTFGDGGSRIYELDAEPSTLPPALWQQSEAAASSAKGFSGRAGRFWFESSGDLHLLENGQLLLLGSVKDFVHGTHRAYVIKLTDAGEYDSTFNERGYMEPERDAWFIPLCMVPQGDQFVVSCGYPSLGAIARYNQDGTLDRTFGNEGYFIDLDPDSTYGFSFFHRLLLTASNDLVCVGRSGATNPYEGRGTPVICKMDGNGKRVPSYNEGRSVYVDAAEALGWMLVCFGAILDNEERVVLGGRRITTGGQQFAFLARFLDDGRPDTAFGPTGVHEIWGTESIGNLVQEPGGNYYCVTHPGISNPTVVARFFG